MPEIPEDESYSWRLLEYLRQSERNEKIIARMKELCEKPPPAETDEYRKGWTHAMFKVRKGLDKI